MKDLTRENLKKNLWSRTNPFFAKIVIGVATPLVDTIWVGRLIGEDALAAKIVYGAILYLRAIWVGRIPLFYLSSKLLGVQGILIGIAPSYVLAMIVGYCYCKIGRWKRFRII